MAGAPRRSAVPTPLVSFSVVTVGAAGGLVVTASHNPARFNGIKLKDPSAAPRHPSSRRGSSEPSAGRPREAPTGRPGPGSRSGTSCRPTSSGSAAVSSPGSARAAPEDRRRRHARGHRRALRALVPPAWGEVWSPCAPSPIPSSEGSIRADPAPRGRPRRGGPALGRRPRARDGRRRRPLGVWPRTALRDASRRAGAPHAHLVQVRGGRGEVVKGFAVGVQIDRGARGSGSRAFPEADRPILQHDRDSHCKRDRDRALKPIGRFTALRAEPEPRAHPVNLDATAKPLTDLTAPAAHLDEVPREERQHGVRRHVSGRPGPPRRGGRRRVHREPGGRRRAPDRLARASTWGGIGPDGPLRRGDRAPARRGSTSPHAGRTSRAEEPAGGPCMASATIFRGRAGRSPGSTRLPIRSSRGHEVRTSIRSGPPGRASRGVRPRARSTAP